MALSPQPAERPGAHTHGTNHLPDTYGYATYCGQSASCLQMSRRGRAEGQPLRTQFLQLDSSETRKEGEWPLSATWSPNAELLEGQGQEGRQTVLMSSD